MKFTDGLWRLRDGVTAQFATEVRDVEVGDATVTLYAATRPVRTRGDTLNAALVTIRLWSPAPGVLGMETTHHAGAPSRGPDFALAADPATDARVSRDGTLVRLTSGALSVEADTDPGAPFSLAFRSGGRLLTSIGAKGTGFATTGTGTHHVLTRLGLAVGEHVYGLGERFTPFVRNGQVVDLWQADGGTTSEQAYKNVPFYLSDRGYGVFVDDPGPVSFEIGSEIVSRVQASIAGQSLRVLVIDGPTPKNVLRRYTGLTGRPALPPAWSFGLWLSTSFTTDYDEDTVTAFLDGMAERGIPVSVFHFDCFWMREYRWSDFTWDPAVFPDPAGMLARLHERGLRVCVWINPYIAQRSALFAEGARLGHLLRRPDGSVWQTDEWQAGMALVDFTSPDACAWYAGHLRALLDSGVDCFKTDFGERVPTDVAPADGSDPVRLHNVYAQLYNRVVFDLLRDTRGEGDAVVFARSATAGGQQFPVHWGGDSDSSYDSMAETLRGGLSLALSGFGFWSHDIGGFEGTPDPDLFTRWLAFGLLSSHSRLHGSDSYRVPWAFGEQAVAVAREMVALKCRLMPYLYRAAVEAAVDGVPVLRPMLLEFPDDPTSAFTDRQYLLGPDLLVAPVFDAGGEVTYHLPPGRWTSLLTGQEVTGPGWRRERHDPASLPLLVRPGAVLPIGAVQDRPDYAFADGVTLHLFRPDAPGPGSPGVAARDVVTEVPDEQGFLAARFVTRWSGPTVTVEPDTEAPWSLVLRGVPAVADVRGGSARATAEGTAVVPDDPGATVVVTIAGSDPSTVEERTP